MSHIFFKVAVVLVGSFGSSCTEEAVCMVYYFWYVTLGFQLGKIKLKVCFCLGMSTRHMVTFLKKSDTYLLGWSRIQLLHSGMYNNIVFT